MKPIKSSKPTNLNAPSAPRPLATRFFLNQNEADFTPSPSEVARRAYSSYENQGSHHGHAVQHWLAAEAELIAEDYLTRTHRFSEQM